jgi:tetratricopeptide (TPR) repeat protein
MAIFGAPLAQEDHARRAVLAAFDLQQRLRLRPILPTPASAGLAVRLGLDSGLVVVGEVGPAAHLQVTAVGAPTQGALQLQQLAAPGTLLVSAATYHLVQQEVRAEPCGSLALDGGQEPLPVYIVQGLVQRRAGVPQRAPWARSPFVGRQRELALLYNRLEAVRAGEGQVISLVGPPGVGKTRLLTEFEGRLSPDQVTWYGGHCLAYGQAMPYLLVRDIVQQVCGITTADTPETRTAAVRRRLAALGEVAEEDVALVLQLLDLLPVAPETLGPHSPEAQQARTFAFLRYMISDAAQHQPLVLAVENVHWVDPTSEAWLGSLIERLGGMAVLLLMTARPGYQASWGAHAAVTRLVLPPLRAQDSQAILEAVPGSAQLPVARRQQIVAYGAGNPFFVEELTWHAVEHGLAATPVPETVHAVLAARIDQLPTETKDLLQTAAVIGPEVPVPLLQAIARLPEDALQRCLAHLQTAELLYETGLVPEQLYAFKHALTHEVAYGSLLQEQRGALHARIVETLEAGTRGQVGVEVEHLAHHALRGEVWDRAVAYCRQAGAQALARSANREAVTFFEQALGALQHLPESHDTRAQAIDLRLDLRNALWTLGDLERLFANLQEAAGLAEALGDPHRLGWVSVYLLAHFAQVCDPDRALMAGQRALAIAMALGDRGLTVAAQHYLGGVYRSLGDYRQAVESFHKNVACLQGALLQERFGLPGLAAVFARSHLVVALAECGAFAEGWAPAQEGEQLAAAADHPYSRVMASWAVGFRALRQGDLAQAIPVLERAFDLVQGAYLRLAVPWITATLGAAYALAGRSAEALPLLEQAVAQAVAMHYMWDHALRLVWLSEAYLLAGRLDEADTQAQRALEFSRAHQEGGHAAYALWLLGEVAAQRQPPEVAQATDHYQQALALAEALGMRPLVAHCHLGLGTLYRRLGRAQQARATLGRGMALYRAMEMTFWLHQAEAALAEVSG